MFARSNCSLKLKIGVFVTVVIIVCIAVLSAVNIYRETGRIKMNLEDKGALALFSIENTAVEAVKSKDFRILRESMKNIVTKDDELRYVVIVDNSGKAYAHSDPTRDGRIFNDEVGAKAARAAQLLTQNYKRDTGEELVDVALPLTIDGKHWGALRTGIPLTKIQEATTSTILWSSLVGLIIIAIAALISMLVVRSLVRPISKLVEKVHIIANGDLSENVEVVCDDEIGALAKAFNAMIDSMRKIIYELIKATGQVGEKGNELASDADRGAKAADSIAAAVKQVANETEKQYQNTTDAVSIISQMAESINQIATRAQDQSKTVVVTSDVLNQMAVSIQDVAASAQAVSETAQQTSDAAQSGSNAVRLSVTGMQKIRDKVFETAAKIRELGDHSTEIGKIIQVIDDIAEQTNLLALNAAIEAARAGEHGKGFAVVADEVRKLAERSGKATKEIADLIGNIQRGTENAVTAMEDGTDEVEAGAKLAEDAGKALENILKTVEKTYDQVQSISAAAEEISASSMEVVNAMESVSSITEENSASTQELAAGGQQVSDTVSSVAGVARENAAAAQEIASSVEEMADVSRKIANDSMFLAETVDALNEAVSKFTIRKINTRCWDYMNCGSDVRAKCPAHNSKEKRCWLIEGTWCGGIKQGDTKAKLHGCMNCKYFKTTMSK